MRRKTIWFTARTSSGTSPEWLDSTIPAREFFTVYIHSTGVSSGALVSIQARSPAGDWANLDSRSITTNGDTVVQFEGAFPALRCVIGGYVDGSFTVSAEAV